MLNFLLCHVVDAAILKVDNRDFWNYLLFQANTQLF